MYNKILLCDFPDLVKQLDINHHPNIDISKISLRSTKEFYWICIFCIKSYPLRVFIRNIQRSVCFDKECVLKHIELLIKENIVYVPRYKLQKIINNPIIPEPNENDEEIWKDLPKSLLLSRYQVSSLGKIKNKNTNYILKSKPNDSGYIRINLKLDNNNYKSFLIHRLIALTFIENPFNRSIINHINLKKDDNRIINLEWSTISQNNIKINRKSYVHKTIYKPINQYNLNGVFIKRWNKTNEVEKILNISVENISNVLNNRKKSAGGFIWKYANIEYKIIENEIWKQLDINNSKIMVSNYGRIKRENNIPIYGTKTDQGYYTTTINNKTFRIHRLVALTFLQNPGNKPFVNHIDENKGNNKLENLEWITNIDNINHSVKQNKINIRSKSILLIDKNTNKIIQEITSITQAVKKLGINHQHIRKLCNKIYPSYKNYILEWK